MQENLRRLRELIREALARAAPLLLVTLLACGAPVEPPAPEPCLQLGALSPCLESELDTRRCESGYRYVCMPSIATCFARDVVDGKCSTLNVHLFGPRWMIEDVCP